MANGIPTQHVDRSDGFATTGANDGRSFSHAHDIFGIAEMVSTIARHLYELDRCDKLRADDLLHFILVNQVFFVHGQALANLAKLRSEAASNLKAKDFHVRAKMLTAGQPEPVELKQLRDKTECLPDKSGTLVSPPPPPPPPPPLPLPRKCTQREAAEGLVLLAGAAARWFLNEEDQALRWQTILKLSQYWQPEHRATVLAAGASLIPHLPFDQHEDARKKLGAAIDALPVRFQVKAIAGLAEEVVKAEHRSPKLTRLICDKALDLAEADDAGPDDQARAIALDAAAKLIPLEWQASERAKRYALFTKNLAKLPGALQAMPVATFAKQLSTFWHADAQLVNDVFNLALQVGMAAQDVAPLEPLASNLEMLPNVRPPAYSNRTSQGTRVDNRFAGLVALQNCLPLFTGSLERSKLLTALGHAVRAFDNHPEWCSGVFDDVQSQIDALDAGHRLRVVGSLTFGLIALSGKDAMFYGFVKLWNVCVDVFEALPPEQDTLVQLKDTLVQLKLYGFNHMPPAVRERILVLAEKCDIPRTVFFGGPVPSDGLYKEKAAGTA